MNDNLKEWKLVQGALGLVAASALGFYVLSGNFQAREWFPFLPPSPPPSTLLFHADAMRRTFQAQRFSEALGEAEWVLQRDKENPSAIRTRAACLLHVGRFEEAERAFRRLVEKDKKDIPARLALATALRGKGDEDSARGILLRLLTDPYADALQQDAARASLDAMDSREGLFPDQPTPQPRPSPAASPTPGPLPAIAINLPGLSEADFPGIRPASVPLGMREHIVSTPTPKTTPEPSVAAVTLPAFTPRGTPEPGETEPGETGAASPGTAPLEIPPPADPERAPISSNILPATITVPRRILPATVATQKSVPQKPAKITKKPKPSTTKKKITTTKRKTSAKKPMTKKLL